jgi:hypothetical protein
MTKESIPVAGDRLSDGFPSVEKIVKATCGATSGEVLMVTSSGDVFGLCTIPQYAQIMDVGWMVDLAFTASVDLKIGDTDDDDGWAEVDDVGATTTDTGIVWSSKRIVAVSDTAGVLQTSTQPAYALTTPLYSTAGKDINIVVDSADPATGKMSVYIKYHMAYGQKHF